MTALVYAAISPPSCARSCSTVRHALRQSSANSGKLREPLLRLTQLWRAYDARAASGKYLPASAGGPATTFGQGPLLAPSVFNFFSPFYAAPGEISNGNLVSPELQLSTEYLNTLRYELHLGAGHQSHDGPDGSRGRHRRDRHHGRNSDCG